MNITEKAIRSIAVLGALSITFAVCAIGRAGTPAEATAAGSDHRIEAEVGKTFDISLNESTGTGFSWMLEKLPSTVLLADVELTPPAQPRPGAAGRRSFTFLPTQIGDGEIRLVSVRPWAPNPPGSTATYHVHVVRGRSTASTTGQAR